MIRRFKRSACLPAGPRASGQNEGVLPLVELARTSREVAATRARSSKVELLAAALRRAEPPVVPAVVAFLSGELRQRRIGVGWAALRTLPPPAPEPTLPVGEVDEVLARIAVVGGPGAQGTRRQLLDGLLRRATEEEQRYLAALVGGELRQGALEGILIEAVARAAGLPPADVRRALMLRGDLGAVAAAALAEGAEGLAHFRLEVGRPVHPMLASTAESLDEAVGRLGRAVVEEKLDGVRLQAHRDGGEVRLFTRTLDDVTARLPEVVAAVRALPASALVLDGEVLALRPDARPRPFQETASRIASRLSVERLRDELPVTPYFFDLLHRDGEDLIDAPARTRYEALAEVVPQQLRVRRLVTGDPEEAATFLQAALDRGHEGVVVKSLEVAYDAGRRGAGWLKVKPVHTLDLVVLAAEWGSGRRRGWLSNLHLGARDPAGDFVMLGKTFKGLTDAMLAEQTEALLALATVGPEGAREQEVVPVRPELVVEVAFDGVQASPRYPGGMALRFARVLRHRPDKPAAEADTVDAVRAVFDGHGPAPQGGRPGRHRCEERPT